MDGISGRMARPQLKALVAQASQALGRLDAARLEELAHSCAALNRELTPPAAADRKALEHEAREALGDMAILGRVLEATRENIRVMHRLRELRMGRLEYSAGHTDTGWSAGRSNCGGGDGNN